MVVAPNVATASWVPVIFDWMGGTEVAGAEVLSVAVAVVVVVVVVAVVVANPMVCWNCY
jgi:hypothetical protein